MGTSADDGAGACAAPRIVLACTTGKPDTEVTREAHVTRLTVDRWRRRFIAKSA